jgi:two-component system sensor histidine kinase and response regulator WspE
MSAVDVSLYDLFLAEVEEHAGVLAEGLLRLERSVQTPAGIEPLMRAAHSMKGAARLVGLDEAVGIAHLLEEAMLAAPGHEISPGRLDTLLAVVDWFSRLRDVPVDELDGWLASSAAERAALEAGLRSTLAALRGDAAASSGGTGAPGGVGDARVEATSGSTGPSESAARSPAAVAPPPPGTKTATEAAVEPPTPRTSGSTRSADVQDRGVKVSAETLSRLAGLAAEALVEARSIGPAADAVRDAQRRQAALADRVGRLREAISARRPQAEVEAQVESLAREIEVGRETLSAGSEELDALARRVGPLAERLYGETLATRMRPFADALAGLPRQVRDLARALDRQVRLETAGREVPVDRDVLSGLEAPLGHLVRNAIDHGIEPPADRERAGKPAEGVLSVEAAHRAGRLVVTVRDDGHGIDVERLRQRIVDRGLATAEVAARLREAELLDFLFLPGFSTAEKVTDVSGRGVGLDAVLATMQQMGGAARVRTRPGRGTSFELQLPVTRSVLRVLLVDVGGEPFAIPLARIDRAVRVPWTSVGTSEGHAVLPVEGESVGLVAARDLLELPGERPVGADCVAVVLSDGMRRFALEVDGFAGEREIVVRPLDARLGKVADVAAAATLDDGSPVLVLDVDDLVLSIEARLAGGTLRVRRAEPAARRAKRILVVDDSITVREVERQLLEQRGYEVDVAVDGLEAWNALRAGRYDLLVSDVDMPRMTGIELVRAVRADARLRDLPVMIVSYKDREEDRLRGLEAGANHYVTKAAFRDETLARAVADLIGEAATA